MILAARLGPIPSMLEIYLYSSKVEADIKEIIKEKPLFMETDSSIKERNKDTFLIPFHNIQDFPFEVFLLYIPKIVLSGRYQASDAADCRK